MKDLIPVLVVVLCTGFAQDHRIFESLLRLFESLSIPLNSSVSIDLWIPAATKPKMSIRVAYFRNTGIGIDVLAPQSVMSSVVWSPGC